MSVVTWLTYLLLLIASENDALEFRKKWTMSTVLKAEKVKGHLHVRFSTAKFYWLQKSKHASNAFHVRVEKTQTAISHWKLHHKNARVNEPLKNSMKSIFWSKPFFFFKWVRSHFFPFLAEILQTSNGFLQIEITTWHLNFTPWPGMS